MRTIVVDFDKTFIKEHLLVQLILYTVLYPSMHPLWRLRLFIRAAVFGMLSLVLSRFRSTNDSGVRIAYRALRGITKSMISEFVDGRGRNGFRINVNDQAIQILNEIVKFTKTWRGGRPSLTVSSQGSPQLAIERLLQRDDVKQKIAGFSALESVVPSLACHANSLEFRSGIATGRLTAPIVSKTQRLRQLMGSREPCIFVGDSEDESAVKRIIMPKVCFLNANKIKPSSVAFILSSWASKQYAEARDAH